MRLSVIDSGRGFLTRSSSAPSAPYVTTKAKGTGLGLAVRKIAEHGARIDVSNRINDGQIVPVRKYRYHSRSAIRGPHSLMPVAQHAHEKIFKTFWSSTNSAFGISCPRFSMTKAQRRTRQNAAQARTARHNGRPDLVLLDIWMPDTDGVTLLRVAGAGLLTMPVIMMSGIRHHRHRGPKPPASARIVPSKAHHPAKRFSGPLTRRWRDLPARRAGRDHRPGWRDRYVGGRPDRRGRHDRRPGTAPGRRPQPQGQWQTFDLDKPLRDARDAFEKVTSNSHLARKAAPATRVQPKPTGLERTCTRKLATGVDLSRATAAARPCALTPNARISGFQAW